MDEYTTRYCPLVEEFAVGRNILPEKGSFPTTWGLSILFVMEGGGEIRTSGDDDVANDVLFALANMELNIRVDSCLEIYRAGVNNTE